MLNLIKKVLIEFIQTEKQIIELAVLTGKNDSFFNYKKTLKSIPKKYRKQFHERVKGNMLMGFCIEDSICNATFFILNKYNPEINNAAKALSEVTRKMGYDIPK